MVKLRAVHATAHIPANAQSAIFEPLVRQPDDARRRNSIGLGLHIAREIVAAHGGEIRLTSSQNEGTAFTVALPVQPSRSV